MATAGIDYRRSGEMIACARTRDGSREPLACVVCAAMCVTLLCLASHVDAIDGSAGTPDGSGTKSYEENVSQEAADFQPSGVAPERSADRPRPAAAQSDDSPDNVAQGRIDRIKAAVDQALATPRPSPAPAEAHPRSEPLPEANAVDARRQEIKALIADPGKVTTEPEARYVDQLRDEVSDTIVFQEAAAPDHGTLPADARVAAGDSPGTYRVERGDSLWKIAQVRLGDGYKWTRIYQANRAHLRNTNVLRVGQILTIPDR